MGASAIERTAGEELFLPQRIVKVPDTLWCLKSSALSPFVQGPHLALIEAQGHFYTLYSYIPIRFLTSFSKYCFPESGLHSPERL
jgi:hypothetical protein